MQLLILKGLTDCSIGNKKLFHMCLLIFRGKTVFNYHTKYIFQLLLQEMSAWNYTTQTKVNNKFHYYLLSLIIWIVLHEPTSLTDTYRMCYKKSTIIFHFSTSLAILYYIEIFLKFVFQIYFWETAAWNNTS